MSSSLHFGMLRTSAHSFVVKGSITDPCLNDHLEQCQCLVAQFQSYIQHMLRLKVEEAKSSVVDDNITVCKLAQSCDPTLLTTNKKRMQRIPQDIQ